MEFATTGFDYSVAPYLNSHGTVLASGDARHHDSEKSREPAFLRQLAWDIGDLRPVESYIPRASHVGLASISPYNGFAHWRILQPWIDHTAWSKGDAWRNCRLILRLYDVSFIDFNGLNAHQIHDHDLPSVCGQRSFRLPRPGTWQIAEVGFLLRSGEFIPASRSQSVHFGRDTASGWTENTGLLVETPGRVEQISNLWEQESVLSHRKQPKLRDGLRIAAFAFEALGAGHEGALAQFVSELATGKLAQGHEVHLFVPANDKLFTQQKIDGIEYHPLDIGPNGTPLERARLFSQAAQGRLGDLPPFDLFHHHEWITGMGIKHGTRPTVLSLNSVEAMRRNGTPPNKLSREIQFLEREVAQAADCILTHEGLRGRVLTEFLLTEERVHPFPMEGRIANDWESPLDFGQVKKDIGFGPLDRMMLFVGPLEHAAGVDLLLEALPVLLHRSPGLRLAFAGGGGMHQHLEHRAREMGLGYAVRLLGHVDRPYLIRLLRSAEALVLPSRYRVPWDDAVVDLARLAGRPVVTTHAGPAHLVQHGQTGLVTYDNPGSMVWALDQVLSDPARALQMGFHGKRNENGQGVRWDEVVLRYLDLCAQCFPQLRSKD